ncbi:MAG: hypothetical protein MdMp024_0929 [Bacteroidales bacterium]
MTTNLIIDGVDILNRFGVFTAKGGYNDLLTFPAIKEPEAEVWPEEDGIAVDLSAPKLAAKEITIHFFAGDQFKSSDDFVDFLSAPGYREFSLPTLGRSWQLRLLSQSAHKDYDMLQSSFSLKFAEDCPQRQVADAWSPGLTIPESPYEIDAIPLSMYGITVLSARDSLFSSPVAKTNLSRDIVSIDGRLYDPETLVFQKKEVSLKCLLRASSKERFWQCYDAFFNALTAPGERTLFYDGVYEEYPCYYKETSGWKLLALSPFTAEFTLTLVFTFFRVDETEYILATEDGELMMTEDGEDVIDLKPEEA